MKSGVCVCVCGGAYAACLPPWMAGEVVGVWSKGVRLNGRNFFCFDWRRVRKEKNGKELNLR
jgi:hypothetical protein